MIVRYTDFLYDTLIKIFQNTPYFNNRNITVIIRIGKIQTL